MNSPHQFEAGIPVIETARLRLRPHRIADLDASAAMWADASVVRYISGQTFTREQTWARLLRYRGMWALMGFGFWLLEEKTTGRFVGEAGFLEGRRELVPSIEGTLELGWAVVPDAQGRGLASEALAAIVEWAGTAHPGMPMQCIIHPDNTPSLRIATRLGFKERARSTYQGAPTIIFSR